MIDPSVLFDVIYSLTLLAVGYLIGTYIKYTQVKKERPLYRTQVFEPKVASPGTPPVGLSDAPTRKSLDNMFSTKDKTATPKGSEPVSKADDEPDIIVVARPDSGELERRKNPRKYEGEEEFAKMLETIPELSENQSQIVEAFDNPITATNDPILSEAEIESI